MIVRRLYDIGGGEAGFTYKEEKPEAEKAAEAAAGGDKPVK